ncbi:MAG: hypothetical protein IAE82_12930 [Opitutaceae bacterium]|nr:hypothetical protein [Opitutaceae bacterium]
MNNQPSQKSSNSRKPRAFSKPAFVPPGTPTVATAAPMPPSPAPAPAAKPASVAAPSAVAASSAATAPI